MGKTWERKKIKSVIFTNYSPGVKNFRLPGKNWIGLPKQLSTCPWDQFEVRGKEIQGKIYYNFLDNEGKNFIFSSKTFRRTCFKNGLYLSLGLFWGKNSNKASIFQQFWTFNKKIGFLSNFFGAVVKTAFYVSLGPFWGKTFIEKTVIYNQFLTSSKIFWPFGKVSGWGCQKCNLCVCIRTFLGESEFWKDLHFCLYIFGHRDNFLAFHLKSFKAVVKTAF